MVRIDIFDNKQPVKLKAGSSGCDEVSFRLPFAGKVSWQKETGAMPILRLNLTADSPQAEIMAHFTFYLNPSGQDKWSAMGSCPLPAAFIPTVSKSPTMIFGYEDLMMPIYRDSSLWDRLFGQSSKPEGGGGQCTKPEEGEEGQ
eukprot:4685889-Pyramimonas_sp.AAC.1